MTAAPRPPLLLCSILYTPAHRGDLIDKALDYGADALCLVLEDSVPLEHKRLAREVASDRLPALVERGEAVFVKANPLPDLEEDVAHVVRPGLAGIVVPKLRSVDELLRIEALVAAAEAEHGCEPGSVALVPLIETPLAATRAFDIASASARVRALVAGTAANGDMARELGFQWTAEGLERLYLRSKLVMDARAADVEWPLDGIYADVRDTEGLDAEARAARRLGYRGKLLIHPSQVDPVNRAFTPSPEEVDTQRRVVEAFERSLAEGSATAVVDGRFVDYAMAATARQVIELAERGT